MRSSPYPILQALLAALLFGASAPVAKLLLGEIEPITLAGLLYLGSGASLLLIKTFQSVTQKSGQSEAEIRKSDLGWLAGAILAGGIAAPILLLFSLQNTPAATASLLLSFEGVSTTLIAALAFNEAISRRVWGAIFLITLASIILSVNPSQQWGLSIGALGILAACVLWGMDNNFTRNISAKDPLSTVTVKGLAAGAFSVTLALLLGNRLPSIWIVLGAMTLGSLSYGLSIVLFIKAMRGLGAARTSALFSTAPLAGILLSFLFLREPLTLAFALATPLMGLGAFFLVNEAHEHNHIHENVSHEHAHSHDDAHHEHTHEDGAHAQQHSHPHTHGCLEHSHHHMPDIHHRHTHPAEA